MQVKKPVNNMRKVRSVLRTAKVKNPETRLALIDNLFPKHLNGTLKRAEANILLRALEEEKKARGENASVVVDAAIRHLRKHTNIQSRMNKQKPKGF